MVRVKWTKQARADLKSICDYIARDSRYYSIVFKENVFKKAGNLSHFPQMGRIVPEFNEDTLRELIIGDYRMMYEVKQERVEVLAVVHGRMKIA